MFDFLSSKFSSIFGSLKSERQLTQKNVEKSLASVSDALLEADVPYDVINQFIAEVKAEVVGKKLVGSLKPDELLMKVVYEKIVAFLGGAGNETPFTFDIPSVTLVMGLQGSGKTTTIAKLAAYIREAALKRGKDRKVLVASVDFYRPAAIDQLETMAQRASVDFYRASATDPISASREIMRHAQSNLYEIVLIDTAGRLHVDSGLLDELKQVESIIKPKYKLLVLDAMTGQESLAVAKSFDQSVGFMGAILTKMDSEARGGSAFAFKYALKKPVLFVGTGEKYTDLEPFRPSRIATRMLDMGDIMTLAEKAEAKIDIAEQKRLASSLEHGRLSLQDFADQLSMISKLGSLSSLVKYLPGVGGLGMTPDMLEKGEVELKKFKAMMGSMTLKERADHTLLNTSRKERVARGAGVALTDVDEMLRKFEQSQQFVKIFKKMGKGNSFFK